MNRPITDPLPLESPSAPTGFGFNFWFLNFIEAGERLSFYIFWPILGIYVCQADEPGGLGASPTDKGYMILAFSLVQTILPIVTGGYADRYGFKPSMIFSMIVSIAGYLLMAGWHRLDTFFAGIVLLGIGASFFKPAIQGALSKSLSRERSSLGWGIFYWVVNIGAMLGHWLSPLVLTVQHSEATYRNLFLVCAACCVLNTIMLLIIFRDIPTGASKQTAGWTHLFDTAKNILEPRLLAWLLIMSAFWMMMYQLWDSQPNFIQDWVDRSSLAHVWPLSLWAETGPDGLARVPQQILVSLNSVLIVLFVVPISHLVRRMRTLTAMLGGMFVITFGMFITSATQTAWILLVGIAFFSLGEMLVGPKKSEYLSLIAPAHKKALYLGYVVIPTGIGRGLGNWLSGWLYGRVGEKAVLAQKYLLEKTDFGSDRKWDGHVSSLTDALGVPREESFAKLQSVLNLDAPAATQLLWEHYSPHLWFWSPFVVIGILATIALYTYGRMARKWADLNA